MKWFVSMHYYVLLFIFWDGFLSINTFPASSNSIENYGNNIKETLKKRQYSGPVEKIVTSSADCSSLVEDSDTNLPEEPPKVTNEEEINFPDEMTKEELAFWMENLATTANPPTTKNHRGFHFLIYPGTKWCGAGNIADDYDDLGTEVETDKCCRTHDSCEDFISGGETKYNLTNKSSFTSLSCECDEKLYECLRQVNTKTSNTVGGLFFNVFSRNCFILDHPKKCKKYVTSTKGTGPLKICAEYEPDTLKEKIYQWTSPKKYETL